MTFNTLKKSIQILDLFLMKESIGENEISQTLNMPRSTAYKYLNVLRQYDLLNYNSNSKQYMLGPKFLEYSRVSNLHTTVGKIALPYLKQLFNEVQETVTLDVSKNDNVYYTLEEVQKREGIGFIAHPSHLPLHCGASGLVLLAFSGKTNIESYLNNSQLVKFTEEPFIDKDKLQRQLKKIRKAGYAYSKGEVYVGGCSVAAPVFHHDGRIFASLCVIGFIYKMDDNRMRQIKDIVIDFANKITKKLKA